MLNANSSKTVKAMDFKSETRVPRDSLDMTWALKNFSTFGHGLSHLTAINSPGSGRYMHAQVYLLVFIYNVTNECLNAMLQNTFLHASNFRECKIAKLNTIENSVYLSKACY